MAWVGYVAVTPELGVKINPKVAIATGFGYHKLDSARKPMPRIKPPSSMPPKISSTPRRNCEAGEQVELYKMMTKRQRIHHEIQMMKQRMELLNSQLSLLDSQIEAKEKTIQEGRQSSDQGGAAFSGEIKPIQDRSTQSHPPICEPIPRGNSHSFKTFHLEY
ncbi:hypothetical protein [Laspinema palackyanum]|uniref:hypothetical protein n=1 Tax=Laspinema palackyanum TaxID=3231601 RepID=UPI00345CC2FA|nr:hypothetical protein [Laspinema sp. D2c]